MKQRSKYTLGITSIVLVGTLGLGPVASASDDEVTDNGPPTPREKPKLALGDIDLDKVLTRTKSGRCKLDLPFVKVQFDCNRD